jgi:hypothetical protein
MISSTKLRGLNGLGDASVSAARFSFSGKGVDVIFIFVSIELKPAAASIAAKH